MSCADFDLCSNCEALPIPVHPLTHHMLKMKTLAPVSSRSPVSHRTTEPSATLPQIHVQPRLQTPPSSQAGLVFTSMPPSTSETATELPSADLMTFNEKDTEEAVPTPTIPSMGLVGSLTPDINVLVEPTMESCSSQLASVQGPAPAEPQPIITRAITPEVPAVSTSPVPHNEEIAKDNWQLWPEMRNMLSDIPATTSSTPVMVSSEISTGLTTPRDFANVVNEAASAADLEISQATIAPSPAPSSVGGYDLLMTPDPQLVTLRAAYVADNNIPDGQIFPPGAEFVKSWKMMNDGYRDWPETTQLMWAAGDKLTEQPAVRVGRVASGEEVDIWTGEMKV